MWLIGLMNKKEAKELASAGYDVTVIEEHGFNKLVQPRLKFVKFKSVKGQNLYCVWTDGDVYKELKEVIDVERNNKLRVKREHLRQLRCSEADYQFGIAKPNILNIPEDSVIVDNESWEGDGADRLIKKFYYSNPIATNDSLVGTFIVDFKPNSAVVFDVHSNIKE